MKVFFEAYEYPIEILRQYLSPYFYHAGKLVVVAYNFDDEPMMSMVADDSDVE